MILILLISNAVQNAMVGSDTTLLGGILAATVLFFINLTFKNLMFKHRGFSAFLQEKPEILIHNCIIEFTSLSKLNITSYELQEAIREHGVENFSELKLAMQEIDRNIIIIS